MCNFWVTLADFDGFWKQNRSSFLVWDLCYHGWLCILKIWIYGANFPFLPPAGTMTWRKCWTATKTPWNWRQWSESWPWASIMFTLDVAFKQAGLQVEGKYYRVQFKRLLPAFLFVFWLLRDECLDVLTLQMIARGKNASDLFPAVVKNVACKNIEVCSHSAYCWLVLLAISAPLVVWKVMVSKVNICIEVLFLISESRTGLGFIQPEQIAISRSPL